MFVVPTGSSSSNDEAASLDEEHESPDEVENMEYEQDFHGACNLKMLEGVLVLDFNFFS